MSKQIDLDYNNLEHRKAVQAAVKALKYE